MSGYARAICCLACAVKDNRLAERVGFEPTLRFPPNTLSKRAPSATRTPLRGHQGQYSIAEQAGRLWQTAD